MAEAGTLYDAFIDELRDAYDAEKQLTKALPKMAKAASSPELRTAFEAHLEETRGGRGVRQRYRQQLENNSSCPGGRFLSAFPAQGYEVR